MQFLLRNVTIPELAAMFRRHRDRSPAAYLSDPKTVTRARRLAKRHGIWSDLNTLDPTCSIPVFKRSAYRSYQRIGDREASQSQSANRRSELERAALALWLGHPKADIDYLQDLMWAYCDDWTWVMAAHEGRAIDLGSAMLGAKLAEVLSVCGQHLEDEVTASVDAAIEKHIFEPYRDYRHVDSWKTTRMNWNHVCNGGIIRAALYRIGDPDVLANLVHGAIQHLTYAIDGFTEDGGCEEGPGYWAYGFGHYLHAAHALYHRTGGELNIMADTTGKLARICRYPLAAHIDGQLRATFSDSHHGHLPALPVLLINAFLDMPELYALCALHPDRTLKTGSMTELALYSGFKVKREPDQTDFLLPDLGMAKLRSAPGKRQMTLLCMAGNNGMPHNHNDIGSFIVYKNGILPLVDPGGPVYRRETFGPNRYDILFCNSLGHSIPIINGAMQPVGAQYHGTLQAENLNGNGEKKAVIDMTHAYPAGTVRQYTRTFSLDSERHSLTLEDRFVFNRKPRALEAGFVTYETVRVTPEAVRIGSRSNGICLSAVNCSGRFTAERMVQASQAGRSGRVLTRIRFTPDTLTRAMIVTFRMA